MDRSSGRRRVMHRFGDDMDAVSGMEVPRLTDDVGRRLSINVSDIGDTQGYLVPLENLEISTAHFEYIPQDKRPLLRFCGWAPQVGPKGTLTIGSTGMERRQVERDLDELSGQRSRSEARRDGLNSRLRQIDRLQMEGLTAFERQIFALLPLDLSRTLPNGYSVQEVEAALTSLRVRGWAGTKDYVSWQARSGCLWMKNALIGRRYCVYCVVETGRKTREICTGRPRQTCPRCGRENPYIGQSLPRTFSYFSQVERLDTDHVTRTHRNSPLARLADEHKRALMVDQEMFNLRLPREVYAERAIMDGSPINVQGVYDTIYRWSQGWVPFACRAPLSGQVTNVYQVPGENGERGLAVEIAGAVTLHFDGGWIPAVSAGTWVNESDELVIPAERPKLQSPEDFRKLTPELQKYLWHAVGEGSWLVLEPPAEKLKARRKVLDRTQAARRSGQYRTLFPVALLKSDHVERLYVDVRGCRLGKTYAVDAGVLRRDRLGGRAELHLDALTGSCYNFFHSLQRCEEERARERKERKPRRTQKPAKVVAPAPGVVQATDQVTANDLEDNVVVLDSATYAVPEPSKVEVLHGHTEVAGTGQGGNTPLVAGGTDAGSGSSVERDAGSEVSSGTGPDREAEADPADGHQGQGADDSAGADGRGDEEEVLDTDHETRCPEEGGGDLGVEREQRRVPEGAHQSV